MITLVRSSFSVGGLVRSSFSVGGLFRSSFSVGGDYTDLQSLFSLNGVGFTQRNT
jgi:hypothetical protein